MGNRSSSSVRQIINTKNITKSMVESLNEQVTESVTKSIAKAQTESGSGVVQIGVQRFGPVIVGKNAKAKNIILSIDQNTAINLKTDDQSIQDTSISTNLALAIINNVQSSVNNESMAKLMAEAESSQKLGALSATGGNQVSSNVNAKIDTLNFNESYRKFANVVSNKIHQKSDSLTFKKCIVNTLQQATQQGAGIVVKEGGEIDNFQMNIQQTTTVIQDCVFKTVQTSNIIGDIATTMGFTVVDDTKNKTTSESAGKAGAKQEIKGLESILGMLGSLFLLPFILPICIGLILCCCLSIAGFIFFRSSSSSAKKKDDEDEENDKKAVEDVEEDDKKEEDVEEDDTKEKKTTRRTKGGFRYSSNPAINTVTKALVFLARI
jgi:hypothetical protein